MTQFRLLLYSLIACLSLGLSPEAMAQMSQEDLKRMTRLRPEYPFDQSGDYYWIDTWRLRGEQDTTASAPKPSRWWEDAILGKTIQLSRNWMLGLDGLVDIFPTSNDYEGLWVGYEVFGAKRLGQGRRLVLRSQNYYATKARAYRGSQRALLFYAPERSGLAVFDIGISSGNTTHIANEEAFAQNFLTPLGTNGEERRYIKHYAGLRNSLYLTPRLRGDALALYEHRTPQVGAEGERHQLLLGELRLSYDFGRSTTVASDMPTAYRQPKGMFAPELSLMYRAAVDPSGGHSLLPYSTYQHWGASLRSAYAFSDYQRLDWALVGEGYLSRGTARDYDALGLMHNGLFDRQPLANAWSTGQHLRLSEGAWFWAAANYTAGRLALTHIPLMKRLKMDEQIHLRTLYKMEHQSWWTELAYSIGVGLMGRAGFAYGTDWQGKHDYNFRLSLPFLFLTSRSSTRY